ncbi:hypothetical protein GCM10020001_079870 [Nonomuraea salmonea]
MLNKDLQGDKVDAAWLAQRIGDPSARGIAAALTDLIREGTVTAQTRLPTVRGLARELGVSSGTVAEAWSELRRHGMIRTDRRRGTVVLGPPDVPRPIRYERLGHWGDRLAIDLTIASPDTALLPPLEAALAAAARADGLNDYARATITPRLRAAVEPTWPFEAQSWLAVGGGYEAVQLLCQTAALPGDRIAIEEPTGARLLDILETIGVQIVPVACDEEGPLPAALAKALKARPVAFVYQPRGGSRRAGTRSRRSVRRSWRRCWSPPRRSSWRTTASASCRCRRWSAWGRAFPAVRCWSGRTPSRTAPTCASRSSAARPTRSSESGCCAASAPAGPAGSSRTRWPTCSPTRTWKRAWRTPARSTRGGARGWPRSWRRAACAPAAATGWCSGCRYATSPPPWSRWPRTASRSPPGSRYVIDQAARPHLRLATARLTDDPAELAELADVVALAAGRGVSAAT